MRYIQPCMKWFPNGILMATASCSMQLKLFSAPAATMITSNASGCLIQHGICLGYSNMHVSKATITLGLLTRNYFCSLKAALNFKKSIFKSLWDSDNNKYRIFIAMLTEILREFAAFDATPIWRQRGNQNQYSRKFPATYITFTIELPHF